MEKRSRRTEHPMECRCETLRLACAFPCLPFHSGCGCDDIPANANSSCRTGAGPRTISELAVPIAAIILAARIVAIALPAIVIGVLRQDGYSKRYQRHQNSANSQNSFHVASYRRCRCRELQTTQKVFQTKGPNRANRNRPPTPQAQKRKLTVKFGELISFLSIAAGSKRAQDKNNQQNYHNCSH